ncbi:CDP-archaeol synthase [bacterium]|nr:CDP-archaeol synthase [bacterium]
MLLDFWHYFLELVWLFLPAGCANMAASFFRRVHFLDYPVDFGRSWRGKRFFGDHKTFRGFFFGILSAVLFVHFQKAIYPSMINYSILNYYQINVWIVGLLMGWGALLGDLVRSFIKRRLGTPPGVYWFPFDQIDWLIGTQVFVIFYLDLNWQIVVASLLLSIIIHPLVNYSCYLLKLQKNKF